MSDVELSDNTEEETTNKLVKRSTKKESSSSSSSSSASGSAKQSDSEDDDGLIKDSHIDRNISDSDNIDDDVEEQNEKQEQSTPKRSRKTKEPEPEDGLALLIKSAISKSNKTVDLEPEAEEKLNEAKATSLIEEMDRAFDMDYQNNLKKVPSFERLKFLQKLLKLSHDSSLSSALIKQDILERFKKWFGGLGDGRVPVLTLIELILQILKAFHLKDRDFVSSGIVTAVRELSLKPDSQASKIREELLNSWKRGILNAKSGNRYQKSTEIKIDDNIRETTSNLLFERKEEKRQALENQKRREIRLKQLGIKIEDNSTKPMERQRYYKTVDSIRPKKHGI